MSVYLAEPVVGLGYVNCWTFGPKIPEERNFETNRVGIRIEQQDSQIPAMDLESESITAAGREQSRPQKKPRTIENSKSFRNLSLKTAQTTKLIQRHH